jgi:threonine/homoserine/homoserine lactone efflux protein
MVGLGVQTWRDARTASLSAETSAPAPEPRALRRAAAINLLSPHPWIAWGTALGPLALATWRDDRISGAAFVVAFYALLVGAKVAVAVLVGRTRHRLGDSGYRWSLRAAGLLLIAAGVVLAWEFGSSLVTDASVAGSARG